MSEPSATATAVPMLIAGEWRHTQSLDEVRDPYRGDIVAMAPRSTESDLNDALSAAQTARPIMASMPGYERAALLRRASVLLAKAKTDIAHTMARETGKAIKDCNAEIDRTCDTISLSAEEAIRIEGEHVPLEGSAMGAGKIAMMLRFPVGVVAAITPFNAPVNLAAHKIGPALAAGNTIVLKAPPQSPLCVHKLVEVFVQAGVPAGALNALYGNEVGPKLVRDSRVDFISFTGSSRVGADIKAASGLKRVTLELGGSGQTIVHADANVAEAAPMCARNAMRLAGQSCISVQNVYVHRKIADDFIEKLVAGVKMLKLGDPLEPDTDVGTVIDEAAAKRIENWIKEAAAAGSQVPTGGGRKGAQLEPTVIRGAPASAKVVCEEVFGPVVSVQIYDDIDEVFKTVSASRFGLQCGLFTQSMALGIRAVKSLRTGGVILNGTSTWRTDQLAYGGVKDSGIGREGPRYAVREMTEERLVVFNF